MDALIFTVALNQSEINHFTRTILKVAVSQLHKVITGIGIGGNMHKLNVIARRTVWIHIIILHRVRWYNFRYSSLYEGGQCSAV